MPTSATATISNQRGLHARAASMLANAAQAFSSDVQLQKNDTVIDCKSIMQIMMLAASKGTEVTLHATGSDAELALSTLLDLINRKFDEE